MGERTGKTLDLDQALEQYDSKFRFVLLAATRAEQLVRGARPKVEGVNRKPTRAAMEELRDGMVPWAYGPAPVTEVPAVEGEGVAPTAEGATPEQH